MKEIKLIYADFYEMSDPVEILKYTFIWTCCCSIYMPNLFQLIHDFAGI